MPFIPLDKLKDFGTRIFVGAGVTEPVAQRVMTNLVRSNAFGIHSHGVVRLADYVNFIKSGKIVPNAEPEVIKQTAITAVVDGHWGFGQVVAEYAMQLAIAKAQANGVGVVCVRNSNHIGAIGEYAEMAANAGLVALALVNGVGKLVAPHGGRARLLSTNPIAFAVPVPGERPLLLDFATSASAEGKLKVARNKGAKVPAGYILDKEGASTENPLDFYDGGFLLPAGGLNLGHKGYGLSIMVETMGGLLSGTGAAMLDTPAANGCFFLALKPDCFRANSEEFVADVRRLVDALRTTPPLAGVPQVLIPGDLEATAEAGHQRTGIDLDTVTWQTIVAAGQSVGVEYE